MNEFEPSIPELKNQAIDRLIISHLADNRQAPQTELIAIARSRGFDSALVESRLAEAAEDGFIETVLGDESGTEWRLVAR